MIEIRLNLRDLVLEELRRLAAKEGIELDQYVQEIVTRHVAKSMGVRYLEELANRAPSRERILEILSKVPDVPPMPGDELP